MFVKAYHVYVDKTEHSNEPIPFDTLIHWDYAMNWAEDNASTATWKADKDVRSIPTPPTWSHQEGHWSWPADRWPPSKNGTAVWTDNMLGWLQQTVPAPELPWENCYIGDWLCPPWDGETYFRDARTTLKLATGGKALSKRQTLFSIYARATRVTDRRCHPPLGTPPVEGVAPDKVRILNQTLGKDGYLYRTLQDNIEVDLTPEVASVDYYTFDVIPVKHKLRLLANDNPLDPDRVRPGAKFCVGQKIDFVARFIPQVPNVKVQEPLWVLDPKWINFWWRSPVTDCTTYFIFDSLKHSYTTRAWYYDGGQKQARWGVHLLFDNGQSANVSAAGVFDVHRPPWVELHPYTPYAAEMSGSVVSLLKLGPSHQMHFAVTIGIVEPFEGRLNFTQLVNRSITKDTYPPPATWDETTGGEFWLDGREFYDLDDASLHPPTGAGDLVDSPGTSAVRSYVAISDSFRAYLRFKPNGDPKNIWVTLGRVDWQWTARADYLEGHWEVTSQQIPLPVAHPEDCAFPYWQAVYNNFP